jgi:hypothetical protein
MVELMLTWLNNILCATISILAHGGSIRNNEQDTYRTTTILTFGKLITNDVQS